MNALRVPRRVALVAIAMLVCSASLVSFAESYRGLFEWAAGHGAPGVWAYTWPIMVDTFIAVGELSLFVALADRWSVRSRLAAWTVTVLGLGVSIAGNIGHVASHDLASRATGAIPPIAAAASLTVALSTLKRVVGAHYENTVKAPVIDLPGTATTDVAESVTPAVPATVVEHVPDTVPELLRQAVPSESAKPVSESAPGDVPAEQSDAVPAVTEKPVPKRASAKPRKLAQRHAGSRSKVAPEVRAERLFRDDLAAGNLPSLRSVKSRVGCGTDAARRVLAHLSEIAAERQVA